MRSRAEKRLWHAAWLTVFVGGVLACDREEDVLVETIDLAEGEYSGLSWGGTQVERFHVVARKGTRNRPEDEVVLWSPQHERPCSLGPLVRYNLLQPRSGAKFVLGSPSPARISFFDSVDEHGVGTMSFADIDCERTGFEVADIIAGPRVSLYQPDLTKLTLGVIDAERNLLVVDPWNERMLRTEAKDVTDVMFADGGAWLVEGGQLVKRDLRGRELVRKGTAVAGLPLLLGSSGDLAYVDEGQLIVERLGKSKVVAKDVCGVRQLDGFIPGSLSFYAPCDARQLFVFRPTGELLEYDGPVATHTAQRGQLIIVRETETLTTLWNVWPNTPAAEMKWTEFPRTRVEDVWPVPGSWLLRARMADNTLSLLRIEDRVPAGAPVTVAEGMTRFASDPRAMVWLRGDGALTLTNRAADQVYLQAKNVTSFRFVFERRATGLAYTSGKDPVGLGRLRLKLLTGENFFLAEDVHEYQQVWWPERGILYAQGGDDAALRFARIDLPCEMTSDSPWACGF